MKTIHTEKRYEMEKKNIAISSLQLRIEDLLILKLRENGKFYSLAPASAYVLVLLVILFGSTTYIAVIQSLIVCINLS